MDGASEMTDNEQPLMPGNNYILVSQESAKQARPQSTFLSNHVAAIQNDQHVVAPLEGQQFISFENRSVPVDSD